MSSQKRKRSTDVPSEPSENIYRSGPIEDRSSTFIAYYSPTLKPKELQKHAEIADASHKILAWRRQSNQQAITGGTKYIADHDDDGEKYAGKRVEKVLEHMNVTGACVVARWYGGTMLGPVRFTHIESTAAAAVRNWEASQDELRAKRKKEQDDVDDFGRLTRVLMERDESISVLRALAVQKEGGIRRAKEEGCDLESSSHDPAAQRDRMQPRPNVNETKAALEYPSMPVDRLRQLEKARDATISFLLKRIDRAEAELAKSSAQD